MIGGIFAVITYLWSFFTFSVSIGVLITVLNITALLIALQSVGGMEVVAQSCDDIEVAERSD